MFSEHPELQAVLLNLQMVIIVWSTSRLHLQLWSEYISIVSSYLAWSQVIIRTLQQCHCYLTIPFVIWVAWYR